MAEEQGGSGGGVGGGAGLDWSGFSPPGGSGKGWSPGGAVGSMSKAAAKAEIAAIEADDRFLDKENKAAHWPRQNMLKRRDALYKHVGPEGPAPGMEEELVKQGVTKESLEADQEKFRVRDENDELEKGRRQLDPVFGGREEVEKVLTQVRKAVKTWTSGSFTDRLFKSGTQNSPVIVKAIHDIIQEIDRAEAEQKERKSRRGVRG